MQWIASGFLFRRGESFIHKMDPRARLFMSLTLFVVALLSHSIELLAILISLGLIIVAFAKVLHRFGKSMLFTAVIAVIAFVLNFVFAPHYPHRAVVFGLRLFAVIAATSVFFLTSTPDELEQVMKWLRLPSDFVMVFVIAVRFVPVLLLDAIQIMDAQRSRGLEFDKGSIFQRIGKVIPVMVPLIAVALNRSLDLAEAMDSRAYGASKNPSSLYHLKLKNADYIFIGVFLLGGIVGLYINFQMNLF